MLVYNEQINKMDWIMIKVKLPALKLTYPVLCGGEIERITAKDGLSLQFDWDYMLSLPVIVVRGVTDEKPFFIAKIDLKENYEDFKWLRRARTIVFISWENMPFNENVGAYDLEEAINFELKSLYKNYVKNIKPQYDKQKY